MSDNKQVSSLDEAAKEFSYSRNWINHDCIRIGFKAGAEWQSQQPKTELRWAKDGEGLPDLGMSVNLKIDGRPGFGKFFEENGEKKLGFEASNGFGTLEEFQFFMVEWLKETEETKPVEDKDEVYSLVDELRIKHDVHICVELSLQTQLYYCTAWKRHQHVHRSKIYESPKAKEYFEVLIETVKVLFERLGITPNLLSDQTPKPVSEEGGKQKTIVGPVNQTGRCKICGHSPCLCNRPMDI